MGKQVVGEELIRNALGLNEGLVLTRILSYQLPDGAVRESIDKEQIVLV